MDGKTISVIIPTLNAEKELPLLLKKINTQSRKADEIIVVDSDSDDKTPDICKAEEGVRFIQIQRSDFDHAKTRDMALRESKGDIVIFLTQDAIPANSSFIHNLVKPIEENKAEISTGRQIPKEDATIMECLVRSFNYPLQSHIRTKQDIPKMGIKTFFFSDVCAAYLRDIYLELGGFDYPLKTNEDMFFAAKAINAGYSIAYAADAVVYHSHNFTLKEQYKRNYLQGYEIEKHKECLNKVGQTSEGMRLVKYVSKELLSKGKVVSFIRFGFDCCARYAGSKAGKHAYIREERNIK